MLTSINAECLAPLGDNYKILDLIKAAGFDAYDFSMCEYNPTRPEGHADHFIFDDDYKSKAQDLRNYADKIGLICNQCHAPFGGYPPLDCFDTLLKRSIEIASILGAKAIIVHPFNDLSPEENAKFYISLVETARRCNVKIALENMWNWYKGEPRASACACTLPENFKKHMDLLNDYKDVFVACVDIGHAEMIEGMSAVELIKTLGHERVKCLHIHDNDQVGDLHQTLFEGKINFMDIAKTLKEINYDGDITLEIRCFYNRIPFDFIPTHLKYLCDTAKFLRSKVLD